MPISKNELTKEMIERAMQCETAEDLIAYADEENIKKIAGGKDGTRCSNLERRY